MRRSRSRVRFRLPSSRLLLALFMPLLCQHFLIAASIVVVFRSTLRTGCALDSFPSGTRLSRECHCATLTKVLQEGALEGVAPHKVTACSFRLCIYFIKLIKLIYITFILFVATFRSAKFHWVCSTFHSPSLSLSLMCLLCIYTFQSPSLSLFPLLHLLLSLNVFNQFVSISQF